MDNRMCQEVADVYHELNANGRLELMQAFCAHGDCSVLRHSLGVAYVSLYRCDEQHLVVDRHSLLVAALLHDYYLYDWHMGGGNHRLHGFRHPQSALRNALEDFSLNTHEADAIAHHMFPLTPRPPRYTEGRVLCIADKYCAIYEMSYERPYEELCRTVHEDATQLDNGGESVPVAVLTSPPVLNKKSGTLPGIRASLIAFFIQHTFSTERAI